MHREKMRSGWSRLLCLLFCFCMLLGGCASANKTGGEKKAQAEDTKDGEDGKAKADLDAKEEIKLDESCVKEIKERGYLIVGCKTDVPGLGYYDEKEDSWSGLEVELAYQSAACIFEVSLEEAKEQERVRFVGVTVTDREEKLKEGEVDCLFATYTITDERKKQFAFSESYYTDYIGMMVKTSGENPNSVGSGEIRSIADLDGKYIGVAKNATTRKTFLNYIQTMNALQTAPIFMEYESYEALFRALKRGDIDVMAVDVSILNGYLDKSTKILGDRFGGQRYGAAVRKENAPLLEYLNQALGAKT